ncbi:MAG: EF-P lysine aminoacylase EpmA [Desulfobacterales bacterium]|jgi:lysyl-tRNA synthetase class 2|nr:EF-P lysine aminoacylase EpmA [Desulfobacterales bacterium]
MNRRERAFHVENLARRAEILHLTRGFFRSRGYLEVETPVRVPVPLPEAHIEPIDSEGWVLQPSPEICMKPMLAAGFERIFQICKCFRKGERGRRHLPEMTMLEWYAAGESYAEAMATTEALVVHLARALGVQDGLSWQGARIELSPPWPRLTVAEAFRRHASLGVDEALARARFDELMGLEVEPRLGLERPVFLHDYPAACGSLARLKPEDPAVAERFELYVGGLELCNGFSELTDPVEQRRRFAAELELRARAGRPARGLPERFLEALAALPRCAGNALGLDRLTMLFCDAAEIDEVVAFTPEYL